jgi:hypothetical protein
MNLNDKKLSLASKSYQNEEKRQESGVVVKECGAGYLSHHSFFSL